MNNPYLSTVNTLVGRVLAMQNRNPFSKTYGCFDRNFWHFKTIIDFPSATYQQVVAGLAKLFASNDAVNPYYRHPVIGEAVRAGVLYWCKIQNRDGSFNEYFVNDRSFCPTAYTTYAVASAYGHAEELFSTEERELIREKLLKSARWLAWQKNPSVQNQMIASMNALYWVSRVIGDASIEEAFRNRRLEILNSQDEEGWFPEYGGADTGYSFKAIDLFSCYLAKTQDSQVLSAAIKLLGFNVNFLHPDGTSGGDYNSRCTQHVFPFGLEFLASRDIKVAKTALRWFRGAFELGQAFHPSAVDDKYALYFYFNSYVEALFTYREDSVTTDEPSIRFPELKLFKNAGILRLQLGDVSAWFGYRHNGVCRIFNNKNLVYADSGYLIQLANGHLCATQCEDHKADIVYRKEDDGYNIQIRGTAARIDDSLPLQGWLIPFKLFTKIVLSINRLAYWFHAALKTKKIAAQYAVPIKITRNFSINHQRLIIKDTLEVASGSLRITAARLVHDVTTVHSPSSRFYQIPYLAASRYKPKVIEETPRQCVYEYDIPIYVKKEALSWLSS